MYDKDPLSKPELLNQMVKRISEQEDLGKIFRIKRQGKDADDIFWNFGKVHGLENIAYCDPAAVEACEGNPVKLQKLINNVTPEDIPGISSYQELEDQLAEGLANYKATVSGMGLYPSDKKKLLALPFYLAKRSEVPEPRQGQFEYDLFKEITGSNWHDDAHVKFDEETKITEFDYEKYLNPEILKNIDTNDPKFKEVIKMLNYTTKTKYEKLQE